MERIEESLQEIGKELEKLANLEEISKKMLEEVKNIEEERSQINDIDSGFYKDLSQKYEEKNAQFKHADVKRMSLDKSINEMISSKKEAIVSEIKEMMKYIDENRNVDLSGIDIQKLKDEKEKIEKEIRLNDTTKEEFEKMSDVEKNAVRKAKENYLNNKHRLEEINPTIKLSDTLKGQNPKEKFMQMETLLNRVNNGFNRDNMSKLIEIVKKEKKESKQVSTGNDKQTDAQTLTGNEKQTDEQTLTGNEKQDENKKVEKNEANVLMEIDIGMNSITFNKNNKETYKKDIEKEKQIMNKYKISEKFTNNRRTQRNIDYRLISALSLIDDKNNSLVDAYLTVIRNDKNQKEEIKQCIEKLNSKINIEYRANRNDSRFANLKEKRIARYAKKMGIASLDGISEKSIFDKIADRFSKIKNTKLFKAKENVKTLASGDDFKTKSSANSSRAQKDKMKTINLINQDRQNQGIREAIKINNTENNIEKAAQEQIAKDVQTIKEQEESEK